MIEEIEIPFFTDLYRWVIDLLFDKDEPFTILNAVSFIAAIMSCTASSVLGQPTPDQIEHKDKITDVGFFAELEAQLVRDHGTKSRIIGHMAVRGNEHKAKSGVGGHGTAMVFEPEPPPVGLKEVMASFNFITGVLAITQATTDSLKAASGIDEASTGLKGKLRSKGKLATGWAGFSKLTLGIAIVKSLFSFPIPYPNDGILLAPALISLFTWLGNSVFRCLAEASEIPPGPSPSRITSNLKALQYEPIMGPDGKPDNISGADLKYGIFATLDFLGCAASVVAHTISVTHHDEIPWQGWVVDIVANLAGGLSGLAGYSKQPEVELGCYAAVVLSYTVAYWGAAQALRDGKLQDYHWTS